MPVDNNLYTQAIENFSTADNAYKALHGKQHPECNHAVTAAKRIFVDLKRK